MRPRLSQRLQGILNLVPANARHVADIGAGHGALSAHLIERCDTVIAVDAQPGPFDELCANLRSWNLQERVSARFGDGFSVISAGEVDTAVIAGVGAHTALRIAAQAADKRVRWLLLQCMQHAHLVDPWLDTRSWPVLHRVQISERRRGYATWLIEVAS